MKTGDPELNLRTYVKTKTNNQKRQASAISALQREKWWVPGAPGQCESMCCKRRDSAAKEGHPRLASCLHTHVQYTYIHMRAERVLKMHVCHCSLKSGKQAQSVSWLYFCQRFGSRLNYFRAIVSHEHQKDMINSFPINSGGNKSGLS